MTRKRGIPITSAFAEKFWAKVQKTEGCWLWTGSRSSRGYGFVSEASVADSAHRAAYKLAFGDFPKDLCVLHHCDNPPCVNPSHLFLGDRGDNARDMHSKNRGRKNYLRGDEWRTRYSDVYRHTWRRGEANHKAKLTEEQVIELRRLRSAGITVSDLGRHFGVSRSAVQFILRGKNWKHLVGVQV